MKEFGYKYYATTVLNEDIRATYRTEREGGLEGQQVHTILAYFMGLRSRDCNSSSTVCQTELPADPVKKHLPVSICARWR